MGVRLAEALHVVLFLLVLPVAAMLSARTLARSPLPERASLYRGIIVQQFTFFLVSLGVARVAKVTLFEMPNSGPKAATAACALIVLMVAALHPLWRREVASGSRSAYLTMPLTSRERTLWIGVSIAAGVGEEIAYRGVLTVLLSRATGSVALGALMSAIAFGGAHAVQGRIAAVVTMAVALVFQGLSAWSGSLAPVVIVHVVYDLIAGFSYAHLGRTLDYQSRSASPDAELPRQAPT
ncbi:MAG: CPBP family intramembrane glutamic endopeptidase [Gemmatimonadaceae bacterium]